MLEIFVDNQKLDLPLDAEVNVTWENPFILQDRIPLTYSLSFSLPPTPRNLAVFKNPQRQNSVGSWDKMPAQMLFNHVSFGIGKMELSEVEKSLSTNFIGSNISDLVKKKLSDLSDIAGFFYSFGVGSRFWPDFNTGWGKAYKDLIFGQATTIGDKFAACPTRVKDEDWKYSENAYGNYNADKLYLNMWNVNNGSFVFTNGVVNVHGAIFPQPYIHWLIDQIFGAGLNHNFFKEDAELRTLAMITSFHKMYSDGIMSTYRGVLVDNSYYTDDVDNYFYLNSFFPKYVFSEFLKELLKLFCCSLLPRPDGRLDIVHNKAVIENTEVVDWSTKLVGTPTKSIQRAQTYAYGYGSGSQSEDEAYYHQVDSIEVLIQPAKGEGNYIVANTNEVYEKKLKSKEVETDPDEWEYERKDSGLSGNTTKDEDSENTDDYAISSGVNPVPMRIDEYWWLNTNVTRGAWHVPEFPDDRKKNSSIPYIGFMRGFYNFTSKMTFTAPATYAGTYPLLTPYNYDMNGNRVGNYSLAWEGADGLISRFHSEFKAWVEKDRQILKGKFRLTELDLKNIDYMKKYYVRGRLFYLKKIEATLTRQAISLCDVELIEA